MHSLPCISGQKYHVAPTLKQLSPVRLKTSSTEFANTQLQSTGINFFVHFVNSSHLVSNNIWVKIAHSRHYALNDLNVHLITLKLV